MLQAHSLCRGNSFFSSNVIRAICKRGTENFARRKILREHFFQKVFNVKELVKFAISTYIHRSPCGKNRYRFNGNTKKCIFLSPFRPLLPFSALRLPAFLPWPSKNRNAPAVLRRKFLSVATHWLAAVRF